jgi:small-conductance mechanosensitive channel
MNRNPSLKDVIERRAAIRSRRQRITALFSRLSDANGKLAAEDRQLEAAEKILRDLGGLGAAVATPSIPKQRPGDLNLGISRIKAALSGNETVEQLVAKLLGESDLIWWNSNGIQAALEAFKGKPVPMNTLSPTLWKMAKAGVIVRENLNVALASRAEPNKAAAE